VRLLGMTELTRRRQGRGLSAEGYHRLYDAASERLLGFFVRRVPEVQSAVDLWAETWAVAYERRRSFRGREGEHDEAWLFGIAYRELAGYRRSGAIEARALRRLGLERPVIADEELDRVLELGVCDGLRGRLNGALDALPPEHAEAVRLRVVDELPYDELASRLGISQANARARVSRGLRTLATTLEDPHE
jgi:RNA polymerase sigma factor (sigma-70 family)